MLYKLEILINNEFSLTLPEEGISVKLIKNEFNILTTDVANARPLAFVQSFEIPYLINKNKFDKIIENKNNFAEIKYNDVEILKGPIFDFSANSEKDTILISIASSFKEVVDFIGDNVLFLEKLKLSNENFIIGDFYDSDDSEILKFGEYFPMDSTTGNILKNQENIDDFCRPSLSVVGLLKKGLNLKNWNFDFSEITEQAFRMVILPSQDYFVSSFGFGGTVKKNIVAAENLLTNTNLKYNINEAIEFVNDLVQPRSPARNTFFVLRMIFKKAAAIKITILEGENELFNSEIFGVESFDFSTDVIQTKNGIDALSVIIEPLTLTGGEVDFDFSFYNIFSCNETNEDSFITPRGFMFSTPENFPKITFLEILRQWLLIFQIALEINDFTKTVKFYHISERLKKQNSVIDVNSSLLWADSEVITDFGGISKMNTIKFTKGEKKQAHFLTNIASLPAYGNYFNSIFTEMKKNKIWNCAELPNLKYTVKAKDGISVEYLAYSNAGNFIGIYESGKIQPINMIEIYSKYWNFLFSFLATNKKKTTAFKLKLKVFFNEYQKKYKQSNLFYYKNNCLMTNAEYDVLRNILTATFLSVE